ncbi:hypothetical protein BGX26_008174 [Mortierella sp. AD094]|nr:hypothetical protein BGX26_008174 [Mortierella sp. AD094]
MLSRRYLPQPQYQRQSHGNLNHRRCSVSRQQRLAILLIFLLAIIIRPVVAQPPPGPQPGSQPGTDASATTTSNGSNTPTKTQSNSHTTITNSSSANSTVAQSQIISTVTVINGTTTTIVATITAPQPAQQAAPATSSLPKAPQSVFVVQSTAYGKVLPAAGPSDDGVNNNQPVPRPKSSATYVKSSPSSSLFSIICSLLIAAGLVNI